MVTATTTTTTTFSTTKSQSTSTSPGPVRNVRTINARATQKKKIYGYGLIYSSDEEDEDEDIMNAVPAPRTSAAAPATTNGRSKPRYEFNTSRSALSTPARQTNGIGVKTLVIERKERNEEDLYGTSSPPRSKTVKQGANSIPPRQSPSAPQATPVFTRTRSSRQTPYKRVSVAERRQPRNIDDELETDGMSYISTPVPTRQSSKFTMKGGVANGNPITPPTNKREETLQNTNTSPKTPVRSRSPEGPLTPRGGTTWTQWLKNLIPQSVKKVAMARPVDFSDETDVNVGTTEDKSESSSSSPAPEPEESGKRLSFPGAFDVAQTESHEVASAPKGGYVNPYLAVEIYNGRIIGGNKAVAASIVDGLIPNGRYSARPSARAAAMNRRLSAPFDANARGRNAAPWAKLKSSYVQSSVPSSPVGYKRQRTALNQGPQTEEQKRKIAEERLAELERDRRDLQVRLQEQEYERRILKAALGQPIVDEDTDDDSAREEPEEPLETPQRKVDKGKSKATVETPERGMSPQQEPQQTEPVTPARPKSPEKPVPKPSSFLFGGGAYRPEDAPAPPVLSRPQVVEKPITLAPVTLAAPVSVTPQPAVVGNPSESEKEKNTKVPSPPATPTLSHAQLPTPLSNTGPAFLPPPTQPPSLSPSKTGSTLFGSMADAASEARRRAEKHKPAVSSGLRASTIMQQDSPPRPTKEKPVLPPSFETPAKPIPASPKFGARTPSPVKKAPVVMSDVRKHVDMVSIISVVQVDDEHVIGEKKGQLVNESAVVAQIPEEKLRVYEFPKVKGARVGKVRAQVEKVWRVPEGKELDRIMRELWAATGRE